LAAHAVLTPVSAVLMGNYPSPYLNFNIVDFCTRKKNLQQGIQISLLSIKEYTASRSHQRLEFN